MPDDLVLALDNSLDFLNIALGREGELIEERHAHMDRLSSEVLPVRVSRMLEDHAFSARDLSLLLVTLGPGSFTGVRVALAFCKGLSSALRIPLVAVPTPDVLAFPLRFMEEEYLCPLIDAKKGEIFFSLYRRGDGMPTLVEGFHALKPEQVKDRIRRQCLCFGTGVRLCAPLLQAIEGVRVLDTGFQRVSGEALLKVGLARYGRGEEGEIKPIYGRRSEAEIKFHLSVS
jgi:tRNA threonylcarbamoyladenosine biosynthesis protein TsaB